MGCIPSLKRDDTSPAQVAYILVRKPLHREVKEYLQDLGGSPSLGHHILHQLSVRKKEGSLRLCCDYGELNQKSILDRYSNPRIQDMLDALGGSSWSSVLDQGKAYHQGFLQEESH